MLKPSESIESYSLRGEITQGGENMNMEYTIKIKNIEDTQEKLDKIKQLVDEINQNPIKVEIVENELKNIANIAKSVNEKN